MISIIQNKFEGMWAVLRDHPITCANDAPWEIIEMKLDVHPIKVWIRGKNTMWFRAGQCFIHSQVECLIYKRMLE